MPWMIVKTRKRSTVTHSYWPKKAVVIGIDPGLSCTGIGVITRNASTCEYTNHKVIRTATDMFLSQRLALIYQAITKICEEYQPTHAGIERTFVNVNLGSSLILGQARGAALTALGNYGLNVNEIAPNKIKKQVTGNTLASKAEVARLTRAILEIDDSVKIPY